MSFPGNFNPDINNGVTFSENIILTTLTAIGGVTLAAAIWYFSRFNRIRRFYIRHAKQDAKELAHAGAIFGKVVGRDQICNILIEDIRERKVRRPHLVVGPIGAGKTALLVRLTEKLARSRAIPIIIQLQDVKEAKELDFSRLANRRFTEVIEDYLMSDAEADRSWRKLRQRQDKVVVLADGLEEALKGVPDRDNHIRKALEDASTDRLPLVITSRPHGALRALRAAVTYLEPLSEEAALGYIAENSGLQADRRRLDYVVEAANVAESPLYLEIARDLERNDLLGDVTGGGNQLSDPHDMDEWALRVDLLDAWLDALVDGELHEELPLASDARAAVIEYISAFALVGLVDDSANVSLSCLHPTKDTTDDNTTTQKPNQSTNDSACQYQKISDSLRERLHRLKYMNGDRNSINGEAQQIDERLAASWGARMGLVENLGDKIRFQHSIMQAFLGSRLMEAITDQPAASNTVNLPRILLLNGTPTKGTKGNLFGKALYRSGREFVTALIFRSRHHTLECKCKCECKDGKQWQEEERPAGRRPWSAEVHAIVLPRVDADDHRGGRGRPAGRPPASLLLSAIAKWLRGTEASPWTETRADHRSIVLTRGNSTLYRSSSHWDGKDGKDGKEPCPIAFIRDELKEAAESKLLQDAHASGSNDRHQPKSSPDGKATASTQEYDRRVKALELYSAALDVDSFDENPGHRNILKSIEANWDSVKQYYEPEHELDTAKIALIKRMGESARLIERHRRRLNYNGSKRLYEQCCKFIAYDYMYNIAIKDEARAVRFSIAQEIGVSGDTAFGMLLEAGVFDPPRVEQRERQSEQELIEVFVGASQGAMYGHTGTSHNPRPSGNTTSKSPPDPASLPMAPRGERIFRKLERDRSREHKSEEKRAKKEDRIKLDREMNEKVLAAWMIPMLVHSCTMLDREGSPYEVLARWMRRVLEKEGSGEHTALQLALAQGFKQAANHRQSRSHQNISCDFLREQTWELLQGAQYWYTRLTLLQALTLWTMRNDLQGDAHPTPGHSTNPKRQVKSWMERTAGNGGEESRKVRHHPLFKMAGKMSLRALQSGRPDLFIWIDEPGIVSQIGSANPSPTEPRMHNLWIPPSAGWSTLDPAALQLLGDVLASIVLTHDRGDRPTDRFRRLERVEGKAFLPPCLSKDRTPLDPQRTAAREPASKPGSNCADGCKFELCPYPPKGPDCRVEFSELFCSYQRGLLRRWQPQSWVNLRFRRRSRWQRKVPVAGLRRFWGEMGRRARDEVPGS